MWVVILPIFYTDKDFRNIYFSILCNFCYKFGWKSCTQKPPLPGDLKSSVPDIVIIFGLNLKLNPFFDQLHHLFIKNH